MSEKFSVNNLDSLPAFNFKGNLSPMLLKSEDAPFNSNDYIFELKLDGFRCIAICNDVTTLISRGGNSFNDVFPELLHINKQCAFCCVLDGEIVYINQLGVPQFSTLQKRRALSNSKRIQSAAKKHPVNFVAFDILSLNNKDLTKLPLTIRKQILENTLTENSYLFISRYIENNGIELFNATKEKNLEGIVAKKKNSLYHIGKRRDDWVKIKVQPHDKYRQSIKNKV